MFVAVSKNTCSVLVLWPGFPNVRSAARVFFSLQSLSQVYHNPVFDSLAGVSIAGLLGVMGLVLTEVTRVEVGRCIPRTCSLALAELLV